MVEKNSVKVRLKFKARGELPTGEGLWARQLEGNSGGGTYELENSSYYVPLVVGDVVTAQLDPDGYLQVTGWVRSGDHVLTTVDLDLARCDAETVIARWAESGALWTEGSGSTMLTIWSMEPREIAGVLETDIAAGYARWTATSMPDERSRRGLRDVDFRLAREPEFDYVRTDYWVGDDPYWRERGLDDADYLATVQMLAWEDRRVARALERAQQDRVELYIEHLTAPDPQSLPQLDGPIFDSE
ncbi:hypothetical protein [Nocardioides sp. SYSU DS0651]|uniref:hypothetical protein n=1 Tax=Nocardioides sp. SYSU DS0651 TaxID=3415955 RepID=UPI003F4C262B